MAVLPPANIILLLLQTVLHYQQVLLNRRDARSQIGYNELVKDPVIDEECVQRFATHRLVRMEYPTDDIDVEQFKALLKQIMEKGYPQEGIEDPVTIVTLANSYYQVRLRELEAKLPETKSQILKHIKS